MVVLEGILSGAASGLVWALIGYAKNVDSSGSYPTIEGRKVFSTLAVGAVVGTMSHFGGVPIDSAHESLAAAGLIAVVESGAKAVYRGALGLIAKAKKSTKGSKKRSKKK